MMRFSARIVGEAVDVGVYTIGVAENPDGTGEHVEFHRTLEPKEDDDWEGAPYSLVTHAWNACKSGAVASWGLRNRVLEIQLTSEAESALEVEDGFRLDLHELDDRSVEMLEKGLARVLVDVPRDDTIAMDARNKS